MRHFPFKILILCVLLPPLVYIYTLQFLEDAIEDRYERELSAVMIGDVDPLLDGSVRLQDAIQKNVNAFIDSRKLLDWGVRISVTIATRDGEYLFPRGYDEENPDFEGTNTFTVARENYRLLSEGLERTLDVQIDHNTLIANGILAACVLLSVSVLFVFYRRGARKIRAEEAAAKKRIDELAGEHRRREEQLDELESQRLGLSERIGVMKKALEEERQKASATEDEMVEELVTLEEKIELYKNEHDRQLEQIDELKEKIDQFEKERASRRRQAEKEADWVRKRFNALYKNLAVHDRAVDGFVNLTEDLQIKAEETIHQLNDDPKLVPVKRKVFGKKNRETVFEVIFGYKGRLYYRPVPGNQVEIVVVGTKLTQNKDLAFLDKL